MQETKKWFAIRTIPKWEKKVSVELARKQIQCYCPMHKVQKQWSDRRKITFEPLFKSYLFLKLSESEKKEVLATAGVFNFVQWKGKPAVIRDKEIEAIQRFLYEFSATTIAFEELKPSDVVLVKNGVFMDFKGIVIDVAGKKAKVLIERMGVTLTATFDANTLQKWQTTYGEIK
jgi:transcription antitermination factor NusG